MYMLFSKLLLGHSAFTKYERSGIRKYHRKQLINFVSALLLFATLMPNHSNAELIRRWDCEGHIVNGYVSTNPRYKKYQRMRNVVATVCPNDHMQESKHCTFWLDNKFYDSFYGKNGATLSILKDAFGDQFTGMFTPITGHLFYHISDGEVGTNQDETQRWFEGFCVERS